jgi:DNA-binding MarR family transcriptional regulator
MTSEEYRRFLDLGIPAAVLLTMMKLHEHEFTQREIAELFGVTRDQVGRVLTRLERHQIVCRAPVPSGPRNPQYGRAMFLYRWSGGPRIDSRIGGQP